jgi:uncharacterized protein (DUF305 family)
MKVANCCLVLILIAGFAATAHAAEDTMKGMDHMEMGGQAPTGDPDIDFAKGMIEHHRSGVDMAKVELEKGKDPEMRKLAEDIIKAQNAEIEVMNAWLSKQKQD